ncbi:MAG: hypothetical protein PF541_09600, partial [Prolixibacteraceae bacterium]|nr:hypothetical protein [Prolixibacteraceae bacterium]
MLELNLKCNKWTILIIALLSFCLSGFSAEIERFEHYTSDEGLSQNTITSIHCDNNGFMWFGTMNGLNRFDGYNFKVYQNSERTPDILTNNRVISIWE